MIDIPPPSYEQTIEAISRCDIPRSSIRIQYEDLLQSDEITITDLGKMDESKLRCLKAAVHPFYILTLAEPAQQNVFYAFSRREDRPAEKAAALEWAQARHLIDKVPNYVRAEELTQFAKRLETGCGVQPGSTLDVFGHNFLAIKREVVLAGDVEKLGQLTECLMNMFAASNAAEDGVTFGFIGNEALTEEKK